MLKLAPNILDVFFVLSKKKCIIYQHLPNLTYLRLRKLQLEILKIHSVGKLCFFGQPRTKLIAILTSIWNWMKTLTKRLTVYKHKRISWNSYNIGESITKPAYSRSTWFSVGSNNLEMRFVLELVYS